jgi:hypothetical protein
MNWSNSRCPKTSAEESVRFRKFRKIVAGTSCAIATSPTNRIIVASIISRMLNPRSLLRRLVNADSMAVRLFSFLN